MRIPAKHDQIRRRTLLALLDRAQHGYDTEEEYGNTEFPLSRCVGQLQDWCQLMLVLLVKHGCRQRVRKQDSEWATDERSELPRRLAAADYRGAARWPTFISSLINSRLNSSTLPFSYIVTTNKTIILIRDFIFDKKKFEDNITYVSVLPLAKLIGLIWPLISAEIQQAVCSQSAIYSLVLPRVWRPIPRYSHGPHYSVVLPSWTNMLTGTSNRRARGSLVRCWLYTVDY